MYVLKNICFVCLTDRDTNLKSVLHNKTKNTIFKHVKYALPELGILNCKLPVYICSSCNITLGFFYTFKQKCLKNYNLWKQYIKLLQQSSETQGQNLNELQITVSKSAPIIKQIQELGITLHLDETIEDPSSSSSACAEQTVNDSQNKTDDNKEKSEEQIASNIKDEKKDTLLESEDNIKQEFNPQPEFVNVKCEPVSDDEQNGGSSEVMNALDNEETVSQELKCLLCNELFSDKTIFDTHLRDHINNLKGVECSICKKMWSQNNELRRHMKLHLGIKDFECTICHGKFANKTGLNIHLKIHAGVKEMCGICNKEYAYLKEHMLTHSNVKNFECTICNKKFSKKKALKIHLQRHASIKEFECKVCHKKFSTNSEYKVHMDTHAGIRKFECTICKKKYVANSTLTQHMKYHLNVRNYECAICKKKFVTNSNLQSHLNYHTGIKRFECPVCKKTFMQSIHLRNHVSKRHKDTKCD